MDGSHHDAKHKFILTSQRLSTIASEAVGEIGLGQRIDVAMLYRLSGMLLRAEQVR